MSSKSTVNWTSADAVVFQSGSLLARPPAPPTCLYGYLNTKLAGQATCSTNLSVWVHPTQSLQARPPAPPTCLYGCTLNTKLAGQATCSTNLSVWVPPQHKACRPGHLLHQLVCMGAPSTQSLQATLLTMGAPSTQSLQARPPAPPTCLYGCPLAGQATCSTDLSVWVPLNTKLAGQATLQARPPAPPTCLYGCPLNTKLAGQATCSTNLSVWVPPQHKACRPGHLLHQLVCMGAPSTQSLQARPPAPPTCLYGCPLNTKA